jgi:hypothetical protein
MGYCKYESETKKVLGAEKLQLHPPPAKKMQQSNIINHVYDLFFSENAPRRNDIGIADVVLIEIQMKSRMLQIQQVIGTFLHSMNKPYKFISPRSVNTHFKIGKKYRPAIAGTKKLVDRKHYNLNKKDGLRIMSDRFPELFRNITAEKRDDIADSLKQAVYFAELIDRKNKPRKRKATTTKTKAKKKTKKK